MGTNEFQQAGDGGRRDAGDNDAGRLRDESRFDPREREQTTNLDAARANAVEKNGPMDGWLSITEKPKEFEQKTNELAKQSPEQIRETLKKNDEAIQSMEKLQAGLNARIQAVLKAQAAHEALKH